MDREKLDQRTMFSDFQVRAWDKIMNAGIFQLVIKDWI